jgi:hypothetical protein
MFTRVCRTAAILAVAMCILSSLSATSAQALQPTYQSAGGANVLPSTAVAVYSQVPSPEGGLLQSDGHRVYLPILTSAASVIPLPPSSEIAGDSELPAVLTAERAPARAGRGR